MEENIKEILTRQQLYDLVWANTIVALAKKYAIKEKDLRNVLTRMNIPIPDNGHWIKIQFGKNVQVKPLPDDANCQQQVELQIRKEGEDYTNDPVKKLAKEIKVIVPAHLQSPDELVVQAKQILTAKAKVIHSGTLRTYSDALDMNVSRESVDRALLLMDVFIKSLKRRGHSIIFKNGETFAKVKGQDLQIKLREQTKRVKGENSWPEYVPTGILYFKIDRYPDKEFKDGHLKLESKLAEIIAWMEIQADKDNARDEEWRLEKEAAKLEEERVRLIEGRRENEMERYRKLGEDAKRWKQAMVIREYIDEVERQGGLEPGVLIKGFTSETSPTPFDLQQWIDWARKKADWVDPVVSGEDEVLGRYGQL